MAYLSSKNTARKRKTSGHRVRNSCKKLPIASTFLFDNTWSIPDNTVSPSIKDTCKVAPQTLKVVLRKEQAHAVKDGIYHKIQIEFTYNSNHIEESRITHDETRYLYEMNKIGIENKSLNVDNIIETVNHFRCIDYIIEKSDNIVTEKMLKDLHMILKTGTSYTRNPWFVVGNYKKHPNEVNDLETTQPKDVRKKMKELLNTYKKHDRPSFDTLLDFHVQFERIHPFQNGNGRIGRLILFKECLKNKIVPFIITDADKPFYYRGLSAWNTEKSYLRDTCLTAQATMKKYFDHFMITYHE